MRVSNKRVFALLAWAVVCLGLATSQALAANGKIAGVVKDQSTGEALPGVNVTTDVSGRIIGATTDADGRYFLLNLRPGTYKVKASLVGYQAVEKTEISVRQDLTSEVNFDLKSQAIQGETITVVAERPLIEKTQTSSRTSIDASEINNTMPVSGLSDLIDTSPSVFRGFVRGGRKAESKILVDGIDVSDTYFRAGEGTSVYSPYTSANRSSGNEYGVGVNTSSVQSLDIISGTFNAEYDAATAGVINVVTKEGGDHLEGRLFIRAGTASKNAGPDVYNNNTKPDGSTVKSDLEKYNDERQTLLNSGDPASIAKANNYYTFSQATIDAMGYGKAPKEGELSLGGPMSKKGGFYFTTQYNKPRELFPGEHHLSMQHSLKLTYRPSDNVKLTGNALIDDGGILGNWVNRDFAQRFKFYPAGFPGNKKLSTMAYVALTHTLSPKTFYEVKISEVSHRSEFGYSDDNSDGHLDQGETGDFVQLNSPEDANKYLGVNGSGVLASGQRSFFTSDPGNEKYFTLGFSNNAYRIGQPGFYYENLKRNAMEVKADVTSQVSFNHQVKAGILLRYHTVSQYQQRTQVKSFDANFPYETTSYKLHPKEYAAYAQDRVEYQGIIINGGVRIDGFDTGAKNFSDFFTPTQVENLSNGQPVRAEIRDKSVPIKWFVQPRLGISHPITANAAMHYSWGKFYSPPPFSQLFDDYGTFSNPSLPYVMDVTADPVTATAYEIGVQYGINQNHLMDITAYYRDIANYGRVGYAIVPTAGLGYGSYTFSTSFGYADSRGVEVSFERRPGSPWISGRINYAFSYIKASRGAGGASPFPDKTNYNAVTDGGKPIPFDDRYTFNTIESDVNGGGNPLVSGYDRKHRFGLTLTGDFSRLTPDERDQLMLTAITTLNSGFYYPIQETSTDLRARQVGQSPWTFQTDLRLTYGFRLNDRVTPSAFIEVRNLFDHKNIVSYDNSTNTSRQLWETNHDPTGELNRAYSDEGQPLYDVPRLINFGISMDF